MGMAVPVPLSPLPHRCGPPALRHDHHLYHHCPGCHRDHIQVLVSGAWGQLGLLHNGALKPCWWAQGPWAWVPEKAFDPRVQGALIALLLFSPKLGPQPEAPAPLRAAERWEAAGEPAAPHGPVPHHRQHPGALRRLPHPHARGRGTQAWAGGCGEAGGPREKHCLPAQPVSPPGSQGAVGWQGAEGQQARGGQGSSTF